MSQGASRFTVLVLGLVLLAPVAGAGAADLSPELMNLEAAPAPLGGPSGDYRTPGDLLGSVFDFPSDDSVVVGSVGFIDGEQVGYFWSVSRGDSVTESFSGPASITSYTLDVDVIENVLNSGAFVNWDVIINGVTVDNFTVNEGFLGTVSRSESFAAIAGPSYDVELRVTNEVAGGQGSHTFRYAGDGAHQISLGEGGCQLTARVGSRRVAPGDDLDVRIEAQHNGSRATRKSFVVWIEAADGSVVAMRRLRKMTLPPGESVRTSGGMPVPPDLAPGEYWVRVGIDGMLQGFATTGQQFTVTD